MQGRTMGEKIGLLVGILSFGIVSLSLSGQALAGGNLRFEHVMNIGSAGEGPGQFKYVEDFAFTQDGKLLATDAAHAYVQVFDKTSGAYLTRFGGKGDDDHNLEKPEGISVDPNGNVFVADYTSGDVKVYDRNFAWLKSFSEYGSEPGQNIKSEFTDIYDGKYYMPEAGNHRISVWDLQGNFLFTFGSLGNQPGQVNNPEAAKFNSLGELVVSDLKNDRIQVFTKEGKLLRVFGKTGSGPGELKANSGIGIDKDDNIYVGEIGNDRIQVFDKNGKPLTMWGKKGQNNGEFGNIHGVIVDKTTGWVYVADTANNRIQVFKPAK